MVAQRPRLRPSSGWLRSRATRRGWTVGARRWMVFAAVAAVVLVGCSKSSGSDEWGAKPSKRSTTTSTRASQGDTTAPVDTTAPDGTTTTTEVPDADLALSAGYFHTCATKADRTLTCWGMVKPAVPEGTFTTVSAGGAHSCGIETDGTITCWATTARGRPRLLTAPSRPSRRATTIRAASRPTNRSPAGARSIEGGPQPPTAPSPPCPPAACTRVASRPTRPSPAGATTATGSSRSRISDDTGTTGTGNKGRCPSCRADCGRVLALAAVRCDPPA